MSVVLQRGPSEIIHVSKMKNGALAEIVEWTAGVEVVGKVVCRCGGQLFVLGTNPDEGWKYAFKSEEAEGILEETNPQCKVRLLQAGDRLTLM